MKAYEAQADARFEDFGETRKPESSAYSFPPRVLVTPGLFIL